MILGRTNSGNGIGYKPLIERKFQPCWMWGPWERNRFGYSLKSLIPIQIAWSELPLSLNYVLTVVIISYMNSVGLNEHTGNENYGIVAVELELWLHVLGIAHNSSLRDFGQCWQEDIVVRNEGREIGGILAVIAKKRTRVDVCEWAVSLIPYRSGEGKGARL